ncbi:MAG: phospholipase A [Nitrospirota bacterium]|nr:phospholipase A [Nitrospirota bacterium]
MKIRYLILSFGIVCFSLSDTAIASEPLLECARKFKEEHQKAARYECYDQVTGVSSAISSSSIDNLDVPSNKKGGNREIRVEAPDKETKYKPLADEWSLNEDSKTGVQFYRPMYFIIRQTDRPNSTPHSPHHIATSRQDIDRQEAKFQVSFKNELISPEKSEKALAKYWPENWRLWFAYTQQSNWQIFNSRNSSPFRTSNYEPEFILTWNTHEGVVSKLPQLVNFGLVHQSNGQSDPYSRSWNRVYVQGGWQMSNNLSILPRLWYRLPENKSSDDNRNIAAYLGYGDLVLKGQAFQKLDYTVLFRHNMRTDRGRGYVQLDIDLWGLRQYLPFHFKAAPHLQITTGYGESLLDYNHHQTTVGIGVAF